MNVAPMTSGAALLPSVHKLRCVTFATPLNGRPDALMDAIAQELARQGSRIRSCSAAAVEFDGPGLLPGAFADGYRAAMTVRRGSVTFDPASRARLHMELRYDPWLTYALPCLAAAVITALDLPIEQRCFFIALAAGIARENYTNAAEAYERWVRNAVARAAP